MNDDVKHPLWWDIRDRMHASGMPFQQLADRLEVDEVAVRAEAAQQVEIALLEFFRERGMGPAEFLRLYHESGVRL